MRNSLKYFFFLFALGFFIFQATRANALRSPASVEERMEQQRCANNCR